MSISKMGAAGRNGNAAVSDEKKFYPMARVFSGFLRRMAESQCGVLRDLP